MEKNKKVGFFERIKISVFDLENYDKFLDEGFGKAFLYLLKLLFIITIIISLSSSVKLMKEFDVFLSYIVNEFPEFSYTDGNLTIEKTVDAYDKKYDAKLIADTGEVTDEQLEEYKNIAIESGYSAILLKDRLIVNANGMQAESTYSEFFKTFGIDALNKKNVTDAYNGNGFQFTVGAGIFVYSFMVLFVQNLIVIMENILIVALFGWIVSKILKASLRFSNALSISVYCLTLSNILSTLYSLAYAHLGFEIKMFDIMYLVIAYIYMMAVILMNKVDIIENAKNERRTKDEAIERNNNKDIKNEDNKE